MTDKITVPQLQRMTDDGRKIVAVVAWDYQIARIADRAGVDIVSVGDSVGVNLWGRSDPLQVTMDQMLVVAQAVRRGVRRALVSVDLPYGPVQRGPSSAVRAAIRLVKQAGADVVKIDAAGDFHEAVSAVARAGIPVWAQFGITPQTARRHGLDYATQATRGTEVAEALKDTLIDEAKKLQEAGAALLNFTNSGPVVGPEVAAAVSIPVLGGFGGGPWLDGRVRMAHAVIGYAESAIDKQPETYANVAQTTLDALSTYAEDVRAGRQIRGGIPVDGPN
jgi:3-methyl-2-oxobutanoate hydroxymethyltransferase